VREYSLAGVALDGCLRSRLESVLCSRYIANTRSLGRTRPPKWGAKQPWI